MTYNYYIMKIGAIIIDSKYPDRQKYINNIEAFFKNTEVSVIKVDGIFTDKVSYDARFDDNRMLTRGEIGCALAHVNALKTAMDMEFDYVFITGLESELFPHKRMNESKISEEDAEEERRLFYVALTRARIKLYLSYALVRTIFGMKKYNTESEFITDIPMELVDRIETNLGIKSIFFD